MPRKLRLVIVGVVAAVVAVPIGVWVGMAARRALPRITGGEARERALQAQSRLNLTKIASAELRYEDANNDIMPDSLDSLVNRGLIDRDDLISPLTGKKYVWLPAGQKANWLYIPKPQETIVAYDDPTGTKLREVVVLYADTHTGTVAVDASFWNKVAESKKRIAAATAVP